MKKSVKRILAIALAVGLLIGVGTPVFAAAAPDTSVAAAAEANESTRDRALRFAILLIPIIGPFIFLFMDKSASRVPTFIVTLVAPLLGPLLFLFGII